MPIIDTIRTSRIDIDTGRIRWAQEQFDAVTDLVVERLVELRAEAERQDLLSTQLIRWPGAPFEVHVYGDPAVLVNDSRCVEHLEIYAGYGGRVGVVVLWHAPIDKVSAALAAHSGKLAAALMEGRAFRVFLSAQQPQPTTEAGVARTEGEVEHD